MSGHDNIPREILEMKFCDDPSPYTLEYREWWGHLKGWRIARAREIHDVIFDEWLEKITAGGECLNAWAQLINETDEELKRRIKRRYDEINEIVAGDLRQLTALEQTAPQRCSVEYEVAPDDE